MRGSKGRFTGSAGLKAANITGGINAGAEFVPEAVSCLGVIGELITSSVVCKKITFFKKLHHLQNVLGQKGKFIIL